MANGRLSIISGKGAKKVLAQLPAKAVLTKGIQRGVLSEFWVGTYSYTKNNRDFFTSLNAAYSKKFPNDPHKLFDEEDVLKRAALCYESVAGYVEDRKEPNATVCNALKSDQQDFDKKRMEEMTWADLNEANKKNPGFISNFILALFVRNMLPAEKSALMDIDSLY